MSKNYYTRILKDNSQLGPYSMEKLKRVDKPTTLITDKVQRFDQRENGFARAARSDFGSSLAKEAPNFIFKYPISGAMKDIAYTLSLKAKFQSFGVHSSEHLRVQCTWPIKKLVDQSRLLDASVAYDRNMEWLFGLIAYSTIYVTPPTAMNALHSEFLQIVRH